MASFTWIKYLTLDHIRTRWTFTLLTTVHNEKHTSLINVYNAAVVDLAAKRRSGGQHIQLLDMNKAISTSTDPFDDLHPNDQGYRIMGQTYFHSEGKV